MHPFMHGVSNVAIRLVCLEGTLSSSFWLLSSSCLMTSLRLMSLVCSTPEPEGTLPEVVPGRNGGSVARAVQPPEGFCWRPHRSAHPCRQLTCLRLLVCHRCLCRIPSFPAYLQLLDSLHCLRQCIKAAFKVSLLVSITAYALLANVLQAWIWVR